MNADIDITNDNNDKLSVVGFRKSFSQLNPIRKAAKPILFDPFPKNEKPILEKPKAILEKPKN
jgi:hypothetical protein